MEKRVNRFLKLYPWFGGVTGDLLFYIAVDTLFLTVVKEFSAAQIVSLTSISQLICMALQFPVLFVVRRVGNTVSVRIGATFLLASSLFITLGKGYYLVLLGRVFHNLAVLFNSASTVMLENNLDAVDRREDFVHYRTSSNTVYAVLTMLISFVASYMFNLNNYLPMIGCITSCAIGVVLSFFMKDHSDYDRIRVKKAKSADKVKLGYSGLVILSIVIYALYYSTVSNGQSDAKLFIQQEVMLDFDVEQTSLIIGAIVAASRIIRVISNVVFEKLYKRFKDKMGIALPCLLVLSLSLLVFGSFIPQLTVKILVMALGYTVILFIRDPFRLYIQDVVFAATLKEQHQVLLTVLEFGVRAATAGTGLIYSAILLKYPMIAVVVIMLAIAVTEVILSIVLYRLIARGRARLEACAR